MDWHLQLLLLYQICVKICWFMASCRYEMKVREQQESIRSQRKSQVWKCLYMLTRHSLVSGNWEKGNVIPDDFWIQNKVICYFIENTENILTMKRCFCFNVVSLLSKPSLHNNSLIRIKSKLGLMRFLNLYKRPLRLFSLKWQVGTGARAEKIRTYNYKVSNFILLVFWYT